MRRRRMRRRIRLIPHTLGNIPPEKSWFLNNFLGGIGVGATFPSVVARGAERIYPDETFAGGVHFLTGMATIFYNPLPTSKWWTVGGYVFGSFARAFRRYMEQQKAKQLLEEGVKIFQQT